MYTAEIPSAQRLVDVKVGELIRSPGSKRYALKESKIYPSRRGTQVLCMYTAMVSLTSRIPGHSASLRFKSMGEARRKKIELHALAVTT